MHPLRKTFSREPVPLRREQQYSHTFDLAVSGVAGDRGGVVHDPLAQSDLGPGSLKLKKKVDCFKVSNKTIARTVVQNRCAGSL